MSSIDVDSDDDYKPSSDAEDDDDDDDDDGTSDQDHGDVAEDVPIAMAVESPEDSGPSAIEAPDTGEVEYSEVEVQQEHSGSTTEDENEDVGDFDDGMEEDAEADASNRRPVSIQEFLAWRLLGRVPASLRTDDTRRRYLAYEEVAPEALTRGSLWQQVTQATGAAGLARRNQWGHFDSWLDASMDCALQASRTAPYGKQIRQEVLEAVRTDPRVAALATYLGRPLSEEASAASATADAAAAPGGGAGSSQPTGPPTPGPCLPGPAPSTSPAAAATPGGPHCPQAADVSPHTTSAQQPLPSSSLPAAGTAAVEASAAVAAAAAAVAHPPPAASTTATTATALRRLLGMTSSRSGPGSGSGSGGGSGGTPAEDAGVGPPPRPHGLSPKQATAKEATAAAGAAAASALPSGYLTGSPAVPVPRMLMRREQGEAAGLAGGWGGAQMRHLQCQRGIPRHPRAVVDELDSRAYIGQFSADGNFFVAAFQDRRVRLYDVERGWRLRKDITTRMCRWTITDTSISPDQRFVIYSSIIPIVHLVEVGSQYDCVASIANITQIHEPLNFDDSVSPNGGDFRLGRSFGIWSVQWSGDGREIVAGTNDESVVVLDVETRRVVARAAAHDDDVNAVTYADSSPNIIISGSDDTYIKVWDRRTMPSPPPPPNNNGGGGATTGARGHRTTPVGVLVGHTEGLTHLDSRGDGRHVLSNAKDQTAKLWDIRMMQAGGSLRSASSAARLSRSHVPQFNWDYRWQEYPAAGRVVRHPHDTSIQTYRGHSVQHTLIRAYFSPAHTTGQRFVYTGSVEGGVHVYDTVSGQEVEGSPFRLHRKLVRDVSWHPFEPAMATVSWDGTVVRWDAVPPPPGSRGPLVPGRDAFNDYY